MVGIDETMAFVGVDDEPGLDALGAEGVPELEALRGGAFAVAVADHQQGWSLHVLNKVDGGAFGVDGGVVVDGLAEEGDHPLVNGVFAVVALPVADARAGDGRPEARGLGDGEHGHEAAVAPAGDALAGFIDGEALFEGVHSGEGVAQVAVAEVADVGPGELLTLAEATVRVGHEDEVAESGEGNAAVADLGPARRDRGGGAAVDVDQQGVLLRGIVVRRVEQPSLHVEAFVGPFDTFRLAPERPEAVVDMGDLPEVVERPGPDLGRFFEGGADEGNVAGVGGRDAHDQVARPDGLGQGEAGCAAGVAWGLQI